MQSHVFGYTARKVPVIGQGTWNSERDDRSSVISSLRRGISLGMTHIDTAEMYGSGEAEEIVADAIAEQRDKVFLVSKVLPSNASRTGTIATCEKSLKRLRTDHLDCYLLHWAGSHPLEQTIQAFERLQRDGKILSWGVSNFDVSELEEVIAIAGEGRLACNQVLYHLGERTIEHRVIPWCEKHKVAVVGYSPFGHGRFPGSRSGGKVLEWIAAARKATPRQVALQFLVRRPSLFAIPKASKLEHVAENAGAGALDLTEKEIVEIDAAFPLPRDRGRLPII
jgi:diketogulonate reductase-like aldo/keto reductase